MAAALVIRQSIPRPSPTPPPKSASPTPQIPRPGSAPIPNKHLPYCPPGHVPVYHPYRTPATPPDSPPSKSSLLYPSSFLQPAERFSRSSHEPRIYSIGASDLVASLEHLASQQLPDPKHVFPWLHGLNAENQMQLAFFSVRRRVQRSTPKCYRGVIVVKAGGDLSTARIKSAISPDEILDWDSPTGDARFLDLDPTEGFSIRNFQIQSTKMAVMSDIVIYRDETSTDDEVMELAKKFSAAQESWRAMSRGIDNDHGARYNTFVLNCTYPYMMSLKQPKEYPAYRIRHQARLPLLKSTFRILLPLIRKEM